jgi:LacI family transcriptional regulator
VFRGTQRYAQECGEWECYVDEFADRHLAGPTSRRYDGIIARAGTSLARRARLAGIPIVNVWYNSPAQGLPGVFSDYTDAGELAARHLLERGLRRFVCLAYSRDRTHRELLAGFRHILRGDGYDCMLNEVPTNVQQQPTEYRWEKFEQALEGWIASWRTPIGVLVAYNDFTGRYLADTCRRLGRRVPEDVAIVVADNELPICMQLAPSLTAIELKHERVGYEAARLLDRLMRGGRPPAEPMRVRPTGIFGRQSTDFFVAEDELVVAAMRFIADHLQDRIGVDDVARAVHASRRTLERRLRQAAGRSVSGEIRRLRLERAQRMLLDTDLPIKQIAVAAGFGNNVHMYQTFMRFLNTAPSALRETKDRL